ncbi:GxxExxY protein [Flavobacterium sp. FlaQc-48]
MRILFYVHRNLGGGFSEIVYKDALEHEFRKQIFHLKEKKNI